MKNILFVTLDGVGDKPTEKLRNKTPLEAAYTPNLDALAKKGRCGMVYTVGKKIAPESDVALTAILGYDPHKYYTGRGPLEAYGLGLDIKKGNLVLRANFATIDDKGNILDRRVGRTLATKEAKAIEKEINSKVKLRSHFIFKSIGEHRGILVVNGIFSPHVSNTDPAYERQGTFGVAKAKPTFNIIESRPLEKKKQAKMAADVINDFTNKSLKVLSESKVNAERKLKHLLPANAILLRDAGIELPNLPQKKEPWEAVVGYPLEIGLAKRSGMSVRRVSYPPITHGDIYKHLYKCLALEVKKARDILARGVAGKSFWFHFKPIDIPGHDGRPQDKIKMIEYVDKHFFKYALSCQEKKDLAIVVTADHSTPCSLGMHSSDPVPLLINDRKNRDDVDKFCEKDCSKGSLGYIIGKEVLSKV